MSNLNAPLSDYEVLARLLERAGMLVGVDPGQGPDHMSIQHGINRLGNMLRDAEGRNKTLERCLHHEEYKARSLASEKNLALDQRNELQMKYDKTMKYASDLENALALKTGELRRAQTDLKTLRKRLKNK